MLTTALDPPLPSFVTALRGRIDDRVYKTYRRPRGQVRLVVTRVPDFTGYTPTAAQRTQRDRMRAATAYAQRIYAAPAAKAVYMAAAQKLSRCAFRLAISDHLAGRVRVPETDLVLTQRSQRPQSVRREQPRSRPPVGARLDRARRSLAAANARAPFASMGVHSRLKSAAPSPPRCPPPKAPRMPTQLPGRPPLLFEVITAAIRAMQSSVKSSPQLR